MYYNHACIVVDYFWFHSGWIVSAGILLFGFECPDWNIQIYPFHRSDVTKVLWRIKSQATQLLFQQILQTNNKEAIKASNVTVPLWGQLSYEGWVSLKK